DAAQIYGDKAAMLQILRIFLDNAIKYTPNSGSVKLSSIKQGDKVFVSIADNGIGIAAEDFDKIFERGVRLSGNSFVNEVGGSGIGLYMAKVIADSHDITIDVESTVGKGTTFTLAIPII
ncbi:MAG: ATP-binding protein, partial [Selenomonadaceae bacterium]|nr:ATP-binding protein [Selenomonadaceae bacterium]